VAHTFCPNTWEAEAGGFLSSRPARATQRNSVSKNQKKKEKNKKGKKKKGVPLRSPDWPGTHRDPPASTP
jgi:hypothetical protein